VIVSYGLGWDSARLWQMIRDDGPGVLGVSLDRVVLITAMTGSEFADTQQLNEAQILPELRARGVRYVQVARAGEFGRARKRAKGRRGISPALFRLWVLQCFQKVRIATASLRSPRS
jgi:hypothetical protein